MGNDNVMGKNSDAISIGGSMAKLVHKVNIDAFSPEELAERIRFANTILTNLWRKHYHNYIVSPSSIAPFWWSMNSLKVDSLWARRWDIDPIYFSNDARLIAATIRRDFNAYKLSVIRDNERSIEMLDDKLAKEYAGTTVRHSRWYVDYLENERARLLASVHSMNVRDKF